MVRRDEGGRMKDEKLQAESSFSPHPSAFILSLRPFRSGDEADLVRHANNPNVTRHLRERFPQPYTWQAAEEWIAHAQFETPPLNLAITLDDRLIGAIGLAPGTDSRRVSAEVGYWLGQEYWGRGIATRALAEIASYAFANLPELNRLFSYVDEGHVASIRVLEKNGFRLEGRLIGASIKNGELRDQDLYAITRAEAVGNRQ
jgi:RimJ/RimL family protein N-acetyltransferase